MSHSQTVDMVHQQIRLLSQPHTYINDYTSPSRVKPDPSFKPLMFLAIKPPAMEEKTWEGEDWSTKDEVGLDLDSLSLVDKVKRPRFRLRRKRDSQHLGGNSVAEVSLKSITWEAYQRGGEKNSRRRKAPSSTTTSAAAPFYHHSGSHFKSPQPPVLIEMEREEQGQMKKRKIEERRVHRVSLN
ncbi:hypothetical protein TrCOL_g10418 [Triparma columacea]|uniref:Uncharacterized protein n=1 Tax=Triparma columacea TaxID=722753 RepID=A0A9W7GGI9_9STRA|nr:hypothetical protein TrCOL_g10418 [Triparma columacea]